MKSKEILLSFIEKNRNEWPASDVPYDVNIIIRLKIVRYMIEGTEKLRDFGPLNIAFRDTARIGINDK